MGVVCVIDGRKTEFGNFLFDETERCFISDQSVDGSGLDKKLIINSPLILNSAFEGKDFLVSFLYKKSLRESDVFQVMDKKRNCRIGWCLPINSLCSVEHDFFEDEHFLRYAYMGIKCALNSIETPFVQKGVIIDDQEAWLLSDIFDESIALLVISVETLDRNFDVSDWLPSLASNGYSLIDATNSGLISDADIEYMEVAGKYLDLYSVSEFIGNRVYLKAIYSHLLVFEKNPLVKFFYIYQILEFLIELVLSNEQIKIIDDLASVRNEPSKLKGKISKFGEISGEKYRFNLLICSYCSKCEGGDELNSLIGACNRLLEKLNITGGPRFEDSLYPIRNYLFHQFRNFPDSEDAKNELKNVVDCLIKFVPILLSAFVIN